MIPPFKPPFKLRQSTLALILMSLGLAVVPHFQHISLWAIGGCIGILVWRWIIAVRQWPLPSAWVRLLLAALVFVGVVFKSPTFGRDSGVTLLVLMVGFKLLETHTLRDVMVTLFLSYFLVITHFLYSQDIIVVGYMVIVVVLTTMAMIDVNHLAAQSWSWSMHFRLAWRLLLQALPLMGLLFVLFPRLSGPLWGLPSDSSAVTGLSDEMTPGSVSKLSQSDAVAFRVSFKGDIPEPDQRYWRGPIFWQTDGIRWQARQYQRNEPEMIILAERYHFWRYAGFERKGEGLEYTVTLEPHQQKWLFALDMPYGAPKDASITRDFQLLADSRVETRKRYGVVSHLDYNTGPLSDWEEHLATELPELGPRVMALVQSWRAQAADDSEVVRLALQYFRQQPFVYTLNPPLLGKRPTDEFLFETRAGFCEHYAAAFTLLMRAAQIPARVVTGYLGGQVNPLDNYLVVHQADAHAWSEVWLSNRGWVRVDPTSAVLPERIRLGLQASLEQVGGALDANFARQVTTQLLSTVVNRLKQVWDAANNAWYENVLGFGPERQQSFWSYFGLADISWQTLGLLLGFTLGAWLLLVGVHLFWQDRRQEVAVARIYRQFCAKLAKVGLIRHPNEGPLAFAERVMPLRPDLAGQIQVITHEYIQLRYRGKDNAQGEKQLKRRVNHFRPPSKSGLKS